MPAASTFTGETTFTGTVNLTGAVNYTATNLDCTGCVGAGEIATGSVGSAEVAENAIGSSELSPDAVTDIHIAYHSIGPDHIKPQAVGSEHMGLTISSILTISGSEYGSYNESSKYQYNFCGLAQRWVINTNGLNLDGWYCRVNHDASGWSLSAVASGGQSGDYLTCKAFCF